MLVRHAESLAQYFNIAVVCLGPPGQGADARLGVRKSEGDRTGRRRPQVMRSRYVRDTEIWVRVRRAEP